MTRFQHDDTARANAALDALARATRCHTAPDYEPPYD